MRAVPRDWCGDWTYVSRNPNITLQIIKDNPDFPWDWNNISRYQKICIKDIKDYPDFPWNYKHLHFSRYINDSAYDKITKLILHFIYTKINFIHL